MYHRKKRAAGVVKDMVCWIMLPKNHCRFPLEKRAKHEKRKVSSLRYITKKVELFSSMKIITT
jgi:hypothetical protein